MDIEENNIGVEITEQQTNEEQEELSLTSVASSTDFQNIIDDCVLEIFSFLTAMEFCSVSETCVRFQSIIRNILPIKLSVWNSGSGISYVRWGHLSRIYFENELERVLKTFGKALSQLLLSEFESSYLIRVALENCDHNLNILKIHHSIIPAINPVKFTKLKNLQLEYVDIDPNASFAGLNSLAELRMVGVRNSKAVLVNDFPKLKHFTYIRKIRSTRVLLFTRLWAKLTCNSSEIVDDSRLLATFFQCNKTLRTIDLKLDDVVDTIVLKAIVNSCKELDVLRVNCGNIMYTDFIEPMKSNISLGYLELSKVASENLDIFSSLTAFRSLCLFSCSLPNPRQFSSLTQITKLELESFQFPNMLDVVGIISKLVNFEVFNINRRLILDEEPFVLGELTFANIVDVVKVRENVLTMRCKTNFIPKDFEKIRLIRLRPDLLY